MKRTRVQVYPPFELNENVWKKQKIHNSVCNNSEHHICGNCNNVMMASKANHVHCLNDLLKQCEQADDSITNTRSALFYAIGQGYVNCVKLLLDYNCNGLNSIDESGIAPLHMSAGAGYVDIMRELINRGADVNLKLQTDHLNALHICSSFGALDCLKLLLDNGVNPHEQTSDSSMNALHFAAFHGHINCINMLLEYGCQLNSISKKSHRSVLHYALCQRKFECFYYLVEKGADISLIDKNGHSALLCIPLELPSLDFKFIEYFSLSERKKWFTYALINVEKTPFIFSKKRQEGLLNINNNLQDFYNILSSNSNIKSSNISNTSNTLLSSSSIFERIPIIEFCFKDELGKGIGVMREWFSTFENDIISHPCIEKTKNNDNCLYFSKENTFKKTKKQKQNDLLFISIIGSLFAIAFIYNNIAPITLPHHIYKLILDKDIELSDVQYYDKETYINQIVYLQNCSENELLNLELTFTQMEIIDDKLIDIELKPNGKNINVTKHNLYEYLQLLSHHILFWGREDLINEFISSFHRIIPKELIKPLFTVNEIKNTLIGEQIISINDWKTNVIYDNCSQSTPEIQWFWSLLHEFKENHKQQLLSFCSGTKYLPVGGFSKLKDNFPFTINYQDSLPLGTLPTSRTCFNTLILPKCKSKNDLKHKIKLVLKEHKAGTGFSFV